MNTFYEEDPCEENFIVFDGSSLFAATHRGARVAIDMEFQPKTLEEGKYHASYYKLSRSRNGDAALLGTFATRDRLKMVEELERFMIELTPPRS